MTKGERRTFFKIAISKKEYERKIENVKNELVKRALDALYLTSATSLLYLTGILLHPNRNTSNTHHPIEEEIAFIGPNLEKDHIQLKTKLICMHTNSQA